MQILSKRFKLFIKKFEKQKLYSVINGISLVKECANAKFNESIDVSIKLGIDFKKSDHLIRGSTILPFGTGKLVKVAVFAEGDKALEAYNAGAEEVGMESLSDKIKSNNFDFDIIITTPETFYLAKSLGQILGPRGIMPNSKTGTITTEIGLAVKNAKSGQIIFKSDKFGIIHTTIGRASFKLEEIHNNFNELINYLNKIKPAYSKGEFIKKIAISSTMGIGVKINTESI